MPKKKAGRAAAGAPQIHQKTVRRNGEEYTYWYTRVTTGTDPGTGKQVQKTITGKTQKEVRQKLTEIQSQLDNGTYTAPSKMTVAEWLDTWTAEYLGGVKPHTVKAYKATVANHIKPAIGAIKLDALTPMHVQKMVNGVKCCKAGSVGGSVDPKTVKNVHGVLHSALEQAKRCGLIRSNPADGTILPKRVKKEIHVIDSELLPAFFKAIEGHPFQYLYTFDLMSGMRQSELMGLQWPDIDFEAKTVTVKRQLQYLGNKHGGYQYITPKNGKSRVIALPDKAIEALRQQKVLQNTMRLKAGPAWNNPDKLVFTAENGEHLKHDLPYRHLKRIFAAMGVPDLRFHDLRHSYAVLSLQSGCDIKTVQENLGHYAAAFTLDTYAHVTDTMRRTGADKLEAFLDAIGV